MLSTFFVGSYPTSSAKTSGYFAIAAVAVPERGQPEEEVAVKQCRSIEEADWEALLLGLSMGHHFGFSRLPIQSSRKSILDALTRPASDTPPEIERRRKEILKLSKCYESVRYFHCRPSVNPAVVAARRFLQRRTFQISTTLTVQQTLCTRAVSRRRAEAQAQIETWPTLDQLVRFEGLCLDELDIQGAQTIGQDEYEVRATAYLRFQIPVQEECAETAKNRGLGFESQLLDIASHYGLENPQLSSWSARSE